MTKKKTLRKKTPSKGKKRTTARTTTKTLTAGASFTNPGTRRTKIATTTSTKREIGLTAKTVRMKPDSWKRLTEISRTRRASVGSLIRQAVRSVYRA